ncbi:MAG: hypothetical protein ABR568_10700 [Pyrinomonadaceae bacterium]
MPGMKKAEAKPKAAPKRKAKPKAKRKTAVRPPKSAKPTNTPNVPEHTGHTPGMVMPPATTTASPHRHTPGKPEPGSSPTAKPQARVLLGITDHHPSFRVGAYTFGGARDIWTKEKLRVAIGGDLTFYSKPSILDAVYGNHPTSYRVFLRFRPGKATMSQMHETH